MRLLALPGASAHQVFAGMLLRTAFKVLMRAATAITPVGKKTKASKAKSGGRSKNRGSADGENDNDGGDDEEMEPAGRMPSAIVADDEEDPMADEEDTMVTYSAAAIAAAKTGLADMVHLLRMYSLRENAELLDLAAQVRREEREEEN